MGELGGGGCVVVMAEGQGGRTGFAMKRRLLPTQNNLVDGLRVLS